MKRVSVFLGAIAGTVLLVSGCVYHQRGYYAAGAAAPSYSASAEIAVEGPPPAPLYEETVVSPGIDFVWIPGAWNWHNRWEWSRGHWDRPPHHGAVWMPPRYSHHGNSHYYHQGHWR